MSGLLDVDETLRAAARRWGVWDAHLACFVTEGYLSEREAWGALVAEVESLHPRLLDVRECTAANTSGTELPERPDDEIECPTCRGDGYCSECERDCIECDGYQVITRKRMDEIEAEERRRKKAHAEARERYEAKKATAAAALVAS